MLGFVGIKMIVTALDVKLPIAISLSVIAVILTVSIVASIFANRRDANAG